MRERVSAGARAGRSPAGPQCTASQAQGPAGQTPREGGPGAVGRCNGREHAGAAGRGEVQTRRGRVWVGFWPTCDPFPAWGPHPQALLRALRARCQADT